MVDEYGRRELDMIDLADMTEPIPEDPMTIWDKIQVVKFILFILVVIYGFLTQ